MKRTVLSFTLLVCTALLSWAGAWNADNIKMVHLEDSTKYVCNPDHVLSDEMCYKLDTMLNRLRLTKGIETVVVVVKKIENGDLQTFGSQLYTKYGIGNKKQRTGLVVTLSTGDREIRIQPGYGLEGTLPDATCKKIQQVNLQYFKDEEWGLGLVAVMQMVCGKIYGDPEIQREIEEFDEDEPFFTPETIIFFSIIIGIFILSFITSKRKCSKCGKRKMKVIEKTLIKTTKTHKTYRITYRCTNCQHTETIERKDPRNNGGNGTATAIGIAGAILGSMGRGGGGGGSRGGGGSFGGGGYGGGGAGSRF